MSIKLMASCSEDFELDALADRLQVRKQDFKVARNANKSKYTKAYLTIKSIHTNAEKDDCQSKNH